MRKGIGVAAETHAVSLKVRDQFARFKMLTAVKHHVFQKVRQTVFGVGFHQRTGIDQ